MVLLSKKSNLAITLAVALTTTSLLGATKVEKKEVYVKPDVKKESYSIGASTGKYLGNTIVRQTNLGLKVDIDEVVDGFVDALQNKTKLKEKEILDYLNLRAEALNTAQEKKQKEILTNNSKKEKEFLAKNKKRAGVKVTKSGLQYEVLQAGKGDKTKPESIAVVNYKAYLPDGYVFEDIQDPKNPVNLSMVNIIDGLKEGLMLMNAGSKYRFYIPSKLAYKDEHMLEIGPNSTLIFEVDLKQILKPGELRPKEKYEFIMEEKNKKS